MNRVDEEKHQSVRDERERLNLSVGPDVKAAIRHFSGILGMTESQLVVHALLMAIPQLKEQAVTVMAMSGNYQGEQ